MVYENPLCKVLGFDAEPVTGPAKERLSKVEITSGAELMLKKFEEPKYLWDNILPDSGLAVMAASKASGKTMILLQLADAISKGRPFLGVRTTKTKTLFLELELSERRTQQRLLKMGIVANDYLNFAFRWTQGQEGLTTISDAVRSAGYGLVVVDVLQQLWPMDADSNSYQDTYNVLSPLRQLANDLGAMIVLVTHRRKAETADYLDGVIGSVGITANCDIVLSLMRTRGENEAVFLADGNDIEAKKFALHFNADPLGFTLSDASPAEIGLTPERREIMDAIRKLGGAAKPSQIAPLIGKDEKAASYLCRKLCDAGVITKTQFGTYCLPTPPHEPHEPHEVIDTDEISRTSRTTSSEGANEIEEKELEIF